MVRKKLGIDLFPSRLGAVEYPNEYPGYDTKQSDG